MSSMVLDGTTPRSRTTDPVTSVDAGREANLSESQATVLAIFRDTQLPWSDHQLVIAGQTKHWPFSAQRIRSARAELTRAGLLVLVEGEYRLTPSGRKAQVWKLA